MNTNLIKQLKQLKIINNKIDSNLASLVRINEQIIACSYSENLVLFDIEKGTVVKIFTFDFIICSLIKMNNLQLVIGTCDDQTIIALCDLFV